MIGEREVLTVAVGAFLLLVFLKIRYEHGRSIPAEGQLLQVSNEDDKPYLIAGDGPEAENLSLLTDIAEASSGEDLRAIVEEFELDGDENPAFLKKALELEDELTDDDWEAIYQAAEEGTELEKIADQRCP